MAKDTEVRPVAKLTAKQCLAELKELEKDVDFGKGVKWGSKTPIKQLQKLVQEGRDALAEGAKEEETNLGGKDASTDTDTSDESKPDEDTSESGTTESKDESADDESEGEEETVVRTGRIIPGVPRGESSITILVSGGENRTYAKSIQGDKWQTLADQYAQNMRSKKLKVQIVKN